jgi:hypothetical protein
MLMPDEGISVHCRPEQEPLAHRIADALDYEIIGL